MKKEILALIQYRMKEAFETLEEAQILLKEGKAYVKPIGFRGKAVADYTTTGRTSYPSRLGSSSEFVSTTAYDILGAKGMRLRVGAGKVKGDDDAKVADTVDAEV